MRLHVQKTLKLYVGGKFVRSESGRTIRATSARGDAMQVSRTSRKDLRDALQTARAAQAGWEGRTAYNRGQILYRLAEMLEDRREALPTSEQDVTAAVDRVVHHAGWTDKITALLSSLNPVAMAYVNYSMVRGMGVVAAVPNPEDGLLGLVEALCAPVVMGNAVLLLVPVERAELAVALSEALATSDMPGGVVNVLTGDIDEMVKEVVRHDDLDALFAADGAVDAPRWKDAQEEGARVIRRMVLGGRAAKPASPNELAQLAEVKTVWMSS